MKCAKRTNFDENAPMLMEKAKKCKETRQSGQLSMKMHQCERKMSKKRNTQNGRILMKMHQCSHKKSEKCNETHKKDNFDENAPM